MRREMAVHLYTRANGEEDASGPHAATVLRYKKTSMDSISLIDTLLSLSLYVGRYLGK